ncbi:hypothetical protein SeMB42_g03018 [Synchytrium endobioticum]|uniref:GPN-loop GTPase 1 n=1 Tax=Synchytrium endobioticum TaxID=286115 RepID=A0A507D640_9FUNG|nr:hypothetical protein SeLEV6574_g02903 [Synchytrium endobioticum]TPX48410.1 hypothetical protein SeMB42_g03018 [Synchytrium endobioticum]
MASCTVAADAATPVKVPTVLICVGMAGSGKTTLMQRLVSHLHSQQKSIYVVNLDPAVTHVPFGCNIDIRDTVNYKQVMKQYNLGPNGAILTSLNLFTTKFDQVLTLIEKRAPSLDYILIDTPGQIEIFTWSASGAIITDTLAATFPTLVCYIVDTPRSAAPATFMSNMLYACSILYKAKLPLLLAFNKTDVVSHRFAVDWMADYETFQGALRDDGSFMDSYIQSMSLVLDEFYHHLRSAGVSAVTGAGMKEFFEGVDDAIGEYHKEYKPEMERMAKKRRDAEEARKKDNLAKILKEMRINSGGPSKKEGMPKNPDDEEQNTEDEETEENDEHEYEMIGASNLPDVDPRQKMEDLSIRRLAGLNGNYVTSFIAGQSPLANGLALLLIQIILILGLSRLLHIPLSYLRQPRVISEVIAGILLGPTALGRSSWFSSNFFPSSSVNALNMLANLGLILFLLMMGLELDLGNVRSKAKTSAAISAAGVITTFTLSLVVSYVFFYSNMGNTGNFGYFLLFIGVCMSVTAFPVLARILTDQKLLRTPVGVSVISAAAIDDALGWTFLALVVSLINASAPLVALWVFLIGLAFAIFMVTVVRLAIVRLFRWIGSKSNGDHHGIDPTMMMLAFLLCFTASWFTEVLGIHPIFGAFLTGLALPRENGFNVKFTERIEDLVTIVLLPLYFTYSGLKTDITTMNGMSVAYLLLVLVAVTVGKVGGCSTAAKFIGGLPLREALSVGVLMNTKGLVELIFLNIGLDAGILSQQTFAIMVLMAVITTMMTTPLVSVLYPPHVQTFFGKDDKLDAVDSTEDPSKQNEYPVLLCLTAPTVMPSMMSLLSLVRPAIHRSSPSLTPANPILPKSNPKESTPATTAQPPLHVARIILDSDRMSSTMIATADPASAARFHDTALGVFATIAAWRSIQIIPHILVSKPGRFAEDVGDAAFDNACGMVVVPFRPYSVYSSNSHRSRTSNLPPQPQSPTSARRRVSNPTWLSSFQPHSPTNMSSLDADGTKDEDLSLSDDLALQLVRRLKARVGIIVDRSEAIDPSGAWPRGKKGDVDVLVPFYGGPDDREALAIALRSAAAGSCNLKVLVMETGGDEDEVGLEGAGSGTVGRSVNGPAGHKSDVDIVENGDLSNPEVQNSTNPFPLQNNASSTGEGMSAAVGALADLFRKGSTGGGKPNDLSRKISLAVLTRKGGDNQQTQRDRTTKAKSRHELQDEEVLNRARTLASTPLYGSDGAELPPRITMVTVKLANESTDPIQPVLKAIVDDDPSMIVMGRFGPRWNQSLSSDHVLAASERTYGYATSIGSISDLVDSGSTPTLLSRVDSSAELTPGPSSPPTPASPRRGLKVETKDSHAGPTKAKKTIIHEVLGPVGGKILSDNIGRGSLFVVRKVRIPKAVV